MFKTHPFTLKWQSLFPIPSGGPNPAKNSYTNESYYNSSFSLINVNQPSWPPRDIWNNIWYNANPSFKTGFFYDYYTSTTSGQWTGGSYNTLTYAESYIYHQPTSSCCWCECGGGASGSLGAGLSATGFFRTGTWGTWGECRTCRNDYYSTRWWYNYRNYRNFDNYTRYNYIDHNQPLATTTIYKNYSTYDSYYTRSRVD